jgi:diguanylate cyclase (GGDEF)-like protein
MRALQPSPDAAMAGINEHARLSEAMLESLTTGILCTDDQGTVLRMNSAATKLTGWPETKATGRDLDEVLRPLVGTDQNTDQLVRLLLDRSGQSGIMVHRPGALPDAPTLTLSSTPMLHPTGQVQGMVISIIEQVNKTEVTGGAQIQDMDVLTGLLNRHGFVRRLERLIRDAGASSRTHALLILDLDQFKLINDFSGHRAGDALLQNLAQQLAGEIHTGDTIARLGGDEFGVMLCNLEIDEATAVARRLLSSVLSLQFTWDGRIYPLSASIGIVPITEDSGNAVAVMSHADAALYAAKDAGRNRYHLYSANDDTLSRRHGEMEWAGRITLALEQGQFRLATQRITPLGGAEKGDHYEVLIRLQQDDRLVAPGLFIPAAERYGLMGKIDRWVVSSYLDYLEQYPQAADNLALGALNLSGHSLVDESFLMFISQQLSRPHVRAECLCFEVTETAAITNFSRAKRFMEELRSRGCQFSLDDFGSGMSSFGYLRQLPVDYLKIDGLFVRDMDGDPVHSAMVKAINEIGHAMGKKTVAEFVANEQILDKLKGMGVDYAQGYYLDKPRLLGSGLDAIA